MSLSSNWYIFIAAIIIFEKEYGCLKDVAITTYTQQIGFHENVTLYCHYTLENETLLNIKWYRGTYEFYRFDSHDKLLKKSFPFKGIIKVNLSRSNETQVTLTEVGQEFDGTVSCEVTTANYQSKVNVIKLQVISLPKQLPIISTNKNRYGVNDTLTGNCTSSLSYPPSSLTFLVNNQSVETPPSKIVHCNEMLPGLPTVKCESDDRTSWTWLPLNLTLTAKHTTGDNLTLQCVASVGNNISSTIKFIPLKSNEPKHERVTSNNFSNTISSYRCTTIILIATMWKRLC